MCKENVWRRRKWYHDKEKKCKKTKTVWAELTINPKAFFQSLIAYGTEQTLPDSAKSRALWLDLWGAPVVYNEGVGWIKMIEEKLEHVPAQ